MAILLEARSRSEAPCVSAEHLHRQICKWSPLTIMLATQAEALVCSLLGASNISSESLHRPWRWYYLHLG